MVALFNDKSACTGCHSCYNICPQKAINMVADEEGFLYPKIDSKKCVDCNLCRSVCAIHEKKDILKKSHLEAYAAVAQDKTIQQKSSSGGIFSLMAGSILHQNGVVIGARLADDFQSVLHCAVEKPEDLELLRGSKYVQSEIGSIYRQVEQYLKQGRPVYFSGTPCQVDGLYRYLRTDYPQLYTQDLICHGVPSPLAWRKYIQEKQKCYGATVTSAFFRSKRNDWYDYSMLLQFDNGQEYCDTLRKDAFLSGFLSNIFLRPSCYNCRFKQVERAADITLADFWGIQKVYPELSDDCGTSLVLIHSEKGQALFNTIQSEAKIDPVDLDLAISHNSAAFRSVKAPACRQKFMKQIPNKNFHKLVKKAKSGSLYKRAGRMVKRILRKISRNWQQDNMSKEV